MPVTVNGETYDPGCYVDGHWGQYGSSRIIRIADDVLGTDLFAQAERDARVLAQGSASQYYALAHTQRERGDLANAIVSQRFAYADAEDSRNPYGIMTDELQGSEAILWIAEEAENALNAATVGGYWEWTDGEFYLVETDRECPKCGSSLALTGNGDETYCAGECGYEEVGA